MEVRPGGSLSLGSLIDDDDASALETSISEHIPLSSEPRIAIQIAANAATSRSAYAANGFPPASKVSSRHKSTSSHANL